MTRKLNVKFLLFLIVSTGIAVVGIAWLHDRQVYRSIDAYLARAVRAETSGHVEQALRAYRTYLTLRRDDIDVLARYAGLLAAAPSATLAEFEQAATILENALFRDPTRSQARRRLVTLYMSLGKVAEARGHLRILLEVAPRDGELHFLSGRCYEALGAFLEAGQEYEKAIRDDGTRVAAHARLARLDRRYLRASDKADALMDAREPSGGIVATNPNLAGAYLERGKYRREFGIPGSENDSARAMELAPDDVEVRLLAIEVALASRPAPAIEVARRHVDAALAKHPGDVRLYGAASDIELRAKNADAAIARLEFGLKTLPDENLLRWSLTDLLIQANRLDRVPRLISELKDRGMAADLIAYLKAQVLYRSGRWAEAVKLLESVGQLLGVQNEFLELSKRTYITLGECYERLGNGDQRYDAYRRAVDINPARDRLAMTARAGLAAALVSLGRLDTAIDEYRKNLLLPDAPDAAKIVLARLLIFRNLRLPESARRWEEIEALLEASSIALPDSSDVAVLRAEGLSARKQLEPARQLLEAALGKHPDEVELWVALSVLAVRRDRPEEAIKRLDDAEKRLGDRVEIRLARARFWGGRGGPDAPTELGKLTANSSKFSAVERFQLYSGVADGYLRLADLTAAVALWTELAKEQPNNLQIRLVLFDSAVQTADVAAMDRTLAEIRRIEGEDGTLWRYGRARVLMQNAKSKDDPAFIEARSLLKAIVSRRPAWPRAPLAIAEIDDRQGNPDTALKGYQRALNLGDRSPLTIRRTVQLFYQFRRYSQADQVLRTLQEEMPISTELQKLAADVSLQTRDYIRALELARRAVSTNSADYRDHIWLGQLLWTVSRKDETEGRKSEAKARRAEAETALRRAVELASTEPETWVALIQYLSGVNNIAAAEKSIADAEKVIPRDRAALALAQANEMVGRTQRAETLYKQAVDERPDDAASIQGLASFYIKFNRIDEAKPHLNRLIDLKAPDAAWARRILTIALSIEGKEKEALSALSFLNLPDDVDTANLDEGSIEDLRAKARVFALQRNRDRRREAIRILESISRRETNRIEDRMLLAGLYELDGNWIKARNQFQSILSEDPSNVPALASYARGLIRRKFVDDARPWVEKLRKAQPQSPAAAELQSRLAVLDNKPDQAVAILHELIRVDPPQLAACAALLEDLRLYPAAEDLFRRFAVEPGRPANVLTLAEYLGRRGRISEALDLCDKAWTNLPPGRPAYTGIQVLFSSSVEPADCARVAARLETAIKAAPDDIALTFYLANVRILQGRYADAETIFLAAFERNTSSSTPLNNLAWLLSLQDGKTARALDTVNQAISIGGAVPEYLDTRGVIHLAMGRSDLAIKELEDAVAVAPTPDNHFHLAQAYFAAKREIDAVDALHEAQNLGLKPETLHPFERKGYYRLVNALPKKG